MLCVIFYSGFMISELIIGTQMFFGLIEFECEVLVTIDQKSQRKIQSENNWSNGISHNVTQARCSGFFMQCMLAIHTEVFYIKETSRFCHQ